jgi:hypothetical protein
MGATEQMTTVAKGANDVGRSKSGNGADEAVEKTRG